MLNATRCTGTPQIFDKEKLCGAYPHAPHRRALALYYESIPDCTFSFASYLEYHFSLCQGTETGRPMTAWTAHAAVTGLYV